MDERRAHPRAADVDLAERLIALPRASAARRSPPQPERIVEATPLVQEKIGTLAEFEPLCAFLFGPSRSTRRPGSGWPGTSARPRSWPPCRRPRGLEWAVDAIEAALRGVCDELALKPRVVFGLVRIALTGTSISPGLFESAQLLGRDETLARLAAAAARL